MEKDWVSEIRQQAKTASLPELMSSIATALNELRDWQARISQQEPVLQDMLAHCQSILQELQTVAPSGRSNSTRKTVSRRVAKQRTEIVRQAALDMVSQGNTMLTVEEVVDALVSKGLDYRAKGRSGAVGTILHYMPEFRRLATGEFQYVGNGGNQADLWQSTSIPGTERSVRESDSH